MSLQELFDKISNHLLAQNKKAECSMYRQCRYKTSEGLKCAAGCLIPDKDYDPRFEGSVISKVDTPVSEYFREKFSENEISLIEWFQSVHDNCDLNEWKSEIEKIAEFYKLKFTYKN